MNDIIFALKLYKHMNKKNPKQIILGKKTADELKFNEAMKFVGNHFSLFGIPVKIERQVQNKCMLV